MAGMRWIIAAVTIMVLFAGALLGRYEYLRDKGRLEPGTSFLDFLVRTRIPLPEGGEGTGPREVPRTVEPRERPWDRAYKDVGVIYARGEFTTAARALSRLLEEFGPAMQGEDPGSLRNLTDVARKSEAFAALIADVPTDPAAYAQNVLKITMADGKVAYALKVERVGNLDRVDWVDGGRQEIESGQIRALEPIPAEEFRKARLGVIADLLQGIDARDAAGLVRVGRQAHRWGLGEAARECFERALSVAGSHQAIETVLGPASDAAPLWDLARGETEVEPVAPPTAPPPGTRTALVDRLREDRDRVRERMKEAYQKDTGEANKLLEEAIEILDRGIDRLQAIQAAGLDESGAAEELLNEFQLLRLDCQKRANF